MNGYHCGKYYFSMRDNTLTLVTKKLSFVLRRRLRTPNDSTPFCQYTCTSTAVKHTDHLHVKTKLLPVKYHSELLTKQYWLSCYQSHHPCHHLTTLPASARNVKGTLMKFNSEVVPSHMKALTVTRLRTLHSQAVVEAKTNSVPNRGLGALPPDISPLESLLSRSVRTTLAQLCSGHCRLLNSYKARITSGISDVCLECGICSTVKAI